MSSYIKRDEDIEMSKTGLLADDIEGSLANGFHKAPRRSLTSKFVDMACIILNIASTVTLVFLNNW